MLCAARFYAGIGAGAGAPVALPCWRLAAGGKNSGRYVTIRDMTVEEKDVRNTGTENERTGTPYLTFQQRSIQGSYCSSWSLQIHRAKSGR